MSVGPAAIPSLLGMALQHHQARRLPQAEQIYREILKRDPRNFDATHLLGVALHEQGQIDGAIEMIRRAIEIDGSLPEAHYHLGNALRQQKRLDEARAAYEAALRLRGDFVLALGNLGVVLLGLGRFNEAIAACQAALKHQPDYAVAYTNLGNALRSVGRCTEALEAHRAVVRLAPGDPLGHNNLGNSLQACGLLNDAVDAYRQAINLRPDLAQAWCNLAAALTHLGRNDEALMACERAIQINSLLPQAHLNRGNAYSLVGRPDEGAKAYRIAIELDPKYADAHNNLGNALKDQGRIDEAMECYRKTLEVQPNHPGARSNLLYTMHFLPGATPQAIYGAHAEWGRSQASLAENDRFANDRSPDRKLRVGYVSGDFKDHPVGRFLLPLFQHRDREHFKVFCFSDLLSPDAVTRELQNCAVHWHSIAGFLDTAVVDLIRSHQIDILVDLSLHARMNRMRMFARKPAPVQVTYLGYPGTTGLTAIDYRLTDRYLDPDGTDAQYVERSFRLPGSYWCYAIPPDAPDVGELPAMRSGQVTFGCLNNFCKVSSASLGAWGQILGALPGSRLMLHAPPGDPRDRILQGFSAKGIDAGRIEFVAYQYKRGYFETHARIDIALDPFPYNGGTTTCDALAMGVPVVTLAGATATARAGASILSNANLPELVAQSVEQYVQITTDWATDLPRLAELRATLRARLAGAPLTDANACARGIEGAFREMWRRWCARITSTSVP